MNIQSLQHLSQPVSNPIMPSILSVVGNPYMSWQHNLDFQPVHIILSSSNPCLHHQQSIPEINPPDVDTGKYSFRKLEPMNWCLGFAGLPAPSTNDIRASRQHLLPQTNAQQSCWIVPGEELVMMNYRTNSKPIKTYGISLLTNLIRANRDKRKVKCKPFSVESKKISRPGN